MPTLSPKQEAFLTETIAQILATSDLDTVSTKSIRAYLSGIVDYDIGPFKKQINVLVMNQFDLLDEPDNNGDEAEDNGDAEEEQEQEQDEDDDPDHDGHAASIPRKRSASPHFNESIAEPVPVKKQKQSSSSTTTTPTTKSAKSKSSTSTTTSKSKPKLESPLSSPSSSQDISADALLAARLQAEENARPTRVRQSRSDHVREKKRKAKKPLKPRKKALTPANVADADRDGDGSGLGPDGEPLPERKKTGGFHKPMALSPALSDLLGGTQVLSRPQIVKMIWAYIKLHGLQDKDDKRHIQCDPALRAVFKTDRVHMFTMNKLLTNNLFPVEVDEDGP